jgi:hypothetical protein
LEAYELIQAIRFVQIGHYFFDVVVHGDAGHPFGLVEFLVDQSHGLYPVLALLDG